MTKLYSAAIICIVGPHQPMFCKHSSPKVISCVASKFTSCIRVRLICVKNVDIRPGIRPSCISFVLGLQLQ